MRAQGLATMHGHTALPNMLTRCRSVASSGSMRAVGHQEFDGSDKASSQAPARLMPHWGMRKTLERRTT